MKKSWITSLGGILIAVGALASMIGTCLMGECDIMGIVEQFDKVLVAIGGLTLGVAARDKKVTSEEELAG